MSTQIANTLFRPIALEGSESDWNFLRELYASTRADEMKLSGWPQEQIDAFLLQQFEAQHAHYRKHYAGARFNMILNAEREPIGRLYLEERDDEFRVIDIALIPACRGKGIGRQLMQDIIDRAFSVGKAVRIHVEQYNPAMRLYCRLGFEKVEEQGVYHLMETLPPENIKESVA